MALSCASLDALFTPVLLSALDQIATLPTTRALRREQLMLQVALITPLIHVSGFTAPETKAAVERVIDAIELHWESPTSRRSHSSFGESIISA